MPKYNVTTSTGAEAAAAAGRLVSIVASTSTPTPDMVGLDLHCQLLERPHLPFGVQAKGSASPRHSATTIDSDAVDCTTIRDWLELPFPVFIFMTDTISDRTYYVRATADLLARTATGQRAVTPQVPLRNRLTRENIGLLVIEVLCNQRIDQAKIERYRDAYKDAHPDQLFDPMDTDAQLELMRGSDQSAQLALVASLKERREHGQPIPHSLCEGLVGILASCKERVTQHLVTDAIVAAGYKQAVPELVRQVHRNAQLLEYRLTPRGLGYSHFDFLFRALVGFGWPSPVPALSKLIALNDPVLL